MKKTAAERLTELCGNGYCEYATREQVRGWWWRQTPDGKPRGPSFPPKFIGRNAGEAEEYFLIRR